MKGKILFVAGLGIGYVLGTRAGRERYEQLKEQAARLWNDPRVQKQVDAVEGFVKDKAPDVAEFVSGGAKKVVAQVSGQVSGKKPAKPATRTTRSSTGGTRSGSASAKPTS
ncbi:MAG TPA: YtxH domain-containing protein [Pseudolysinimonas sp.]|nr:YtxH domain-containing protein [Pseudolysinimonas sp.]